MSEHPDALTPEYIPAPNDLAVTVNELTFNWRESELTAWVDGIAESYSSITVTEDAIPGIKKEMANLNGIIKQLNADRIAAVKSVSGPIKAFEDKIKGLCAKIEGARDSLASQVKVFEDAAREAKRKEVLFAIETLTAEAGYPGLQIPVQDSWLNKTQKPKDTANAIKAIIEDHITAEKNALALEQAKRDRAESIEDTLAALAERHGFSIPASQFVKYLDTSITWSETREAIYTAFDAKAQQNKKEGLAPAPRAESAPQAVGTSMSRTATEQVAHLRGLKSMSISLEYKPEREAEVFHVIRHLVSLCVNVEHGCDLDTLERPSRPY